MADPNATVWTQIPHTKWPSKCPRCGSGLSNTSYEPYCAYDNCRWNNDGAPVAATLVEAALALLDQAARLRDVGDLRARDLEQRARELLRALGALEGGHAR